MNNHVIMTPSPDAPTREDGEWPSTADLIQHCRDLHNSNSDLTAAEREWCLYTAERLMDTDRIIERLEAERERYRAALAELVACKDLKDQADYNLLYAQTTGSLEKGKELTLEYRTRKGPAWSAARAALKEEI